jgi:hypothetical protein
LRKKLIRRENNKFGGRLLKRRRQIFDGSRQMTIFDFGFTRSQ